MQIYRNLSKSQNCVTCILSFAAKYIFLSLKVWILSKKSKTKTNKQKNQQQKTTKNKQTNKTYFPYIPTQLLSFLHKSVITREQKRFKTVKLPLSSPTSLRKNKKGSVVVVWRYVDTSQTINTVCKRSISSGGKYERKKIDKKEKKESREPDSKQRPKDHYSPLQSSALPAELSRG